MTGEDGTSSRHVRQIAARAIRRLSIFEYAILAAAAALALGAGALAALLLEAALDLPFRPTWAVASLAFFVVPAAGAYLRERRDSGRDAHGPVPPATNEEDGERDQDGR